MNIVNPRPKCIARVPYGDCPYTLQLKGQMTTEFLQIKLPVQQHFHFLFEALTISNLNLY